MVTCGLEEPLVEDRASAQVRRMSIEGAWVFPTSNPLRKLLLLMEVAWDGRRRKVMHVTGHAHAEHSSVKLQGMSYFHCSESDCRRPMGELIIVRAMVCAAVTGAVGVQLVCPIAFSGASDTSGGDHAQHAATV